MAANDAAELQVDDNKIEILPIIEAFPATGEELESPMKMRSRQSFRSDNKLIEQMDARAAETDAVS